MPVNSKDVYRGKRSHRRLWTVLLFVLAALIVAAIVLFFACQKYIVYDSDGLRVVFPILETAAPSDDETGAHESVNVELVYEEPDYSGILSNAGKNLQAIQAQYVTADRITPDGLTAAAAQVKSAGGNALVLQMKAPGGTLSWKSAVNEAAAYGVNGTAELSETIQSLKSQDIYLVAVVSCCVDTLMAQRYSVLALKDSAGAAYSDGSGGWLDPYNETVRGYIVALCKELAAMGFDEIAFSYLQMPFTDLDFAYAVQMSSEPSRTDAVMNLAQYLRGALVSTGVRVSAVCSADSILQQKSAQTGQELTPFTKLFDRICVFADIGNLQQLRSAVAADEAFDAETRFVPFLAEAQSSGSYIKTS